MTETSYLILSVVLFILMIGVQSLIGLKSGHSLKYLMGPREGYQDKTDIAQRARRANANMVEAMVMFVPLILITIHTGTTGGKTLLGAALFFWGRAVYAPLYWFGVPWLRTFAWAISLIGIIMILLSLIPQV